MAMSFETRKKTIFFCFMRHSTYVIIFESVLLDSWQDDTKTDL